MCQGPEVKAVTPPLPLSPPPPSVDRQGDVALPPYYQPEEDDEMPFICSLSGDNGIMGCHEIPPLKEQGRECCLSKDDVYDFGPGRPDPNASGLCVNWNRYYNVCRTGSANPHKGAINFDNIGYAWIVIFQVRPGAGRAGRRGGGGASRAASPVRSARWVEGPLQLWEGGKKGRELRAVGAAPRGWRLAGVAACSLCSGRGRITGFRAPRRRRSQPSSCTVGPVCGTGCAGCPGAPSLPKANKTAPLGRTLCLSCPKLLHLPLWEGVCGDGVPPAASWPQSQAWLSCPQPC